MQTEMWLNYSTQPTKHATCSCACATLDKVGKLKLWNMNFNNKRGETPLTASGHLEPPAHRAWWPEPVWADFGGHGADCPLPALPSLLDWRPLLWCSARLILVVPVFIHGRRQAKALTQQTWLLETWHCYEGCRSFVSTLIISLFLLSSLTRAFLQEVLV